MKSISKPWTPKEFSTGKIFDAFNLGTKEVFGSFAWNAPRKTHHRSNYENTLHSPQSHSLFPTCFRIHRCLAFLDGHPAELSGFLCQVGWYDRYDQVERKGRAPFLWLPCPRVPSFAQNSPKPRTRSFIPGMHSGPILRDEPCRQFSLRPMRLIPELERAGCSHSPG